MPFPFAGEVSALLAPLCWSVAVLLYRRATDLASPAAMTLFKNTFAAALLGLTLLATGDGLPADRSAADWARLCVSGVLGLAVADRLLFEALRRIGAARVALVDLVYAPTVVVLSWLFLGESPTVAFLACGALVVLGVAIANARRDPTRGGTEAVGVLFGLGAIAGTAVGVVLAKPVLEESSLVEVTFTRLVAGVLAQIAWTGLRAGAEVFRPSPAWWTLVPGAFVGTYLSLLFWLGGFKWADASVAAVLNQMATVYIVVLARVVLGETLTRQQVAGGLVAVVGALGVVLSRA